MASSVPQNEVLVCHLTKDDPRNAENGELESKILESCQTVKEEANRIIQTEPAKALAKYLTALDFLHDQPISHADYVSKIIPILNNCSFAALKCEKYLEADDFATQVLCDAPTNIKALTRRFVARRAILQNEKLLAQVLERGTYASKIALCSLATADLQAANSVSKDDPTVTKYVKEWKAEYPQLWED